MNIAITAAELKSRATIAMQDRLVLGMPHLSLGGLSETWLLKELGHRHWQLLAGMAGRAVPDFRDADGTPVYAAFCAVSIADARFDALREHDELAISSELARISRTQFASRHRLSCRGRPVGTVELSSVFVRRSEPGRNRSIARIALDIFPAADPPEGFGAAATMAAKMRGAWSEHFGFDRAGAGDATRLVINPCPSQDFNGADFLYFAAFQAFVDRAEWELLAPLQPRSTSARDIVYHGNVEIGDRIVVELKAQRAERDGLSHWCQLRRLADGALLADVFTRRR
ncbi:Pnap_2097 family protein [Bosea sp. 117]|uniref:Pnap_2097 family protein n=1 Tax=Bosea sp. 117 TaxID=1125973 RepID=UPI000571519C|nr:Pnap_2097 family protein [Bosea sp. 117]